MSANAVPSSSSVTATEDFAKLGEDLAFQGAVVSVFRTEFRTPDGQIVDRDIVRHPGAVSVVPVHADGSVVLVRQFRAPMEGVLYEIPAGKRDVAGEPPEVTARRELIEEVGLQAERLRPLIQLLHSPGFCDEVNHLFLATGLTEVARAVDGPEEEHMTIERVPLSDAIAMVRSGVIADAKTVVGLLLAEAVLSGDATPGA
ncbi:MAG: NUDIX hydrolase [Microthrixaceae bacterium]|nr:NUDIX hydrolase [Microthrixaceae bacterium]